MTEMPHNDETRWRQMLSDDLDEDVDDYLPLVSQMQQWQAPPVDGAMRSRLLERIQREQAAQRIIGQQRFADWWPLLLLRSQVKVVRGEIWLASLLLIVLGTGVTLARGDSSAAMLPLVVLAPVVSVFAVSLLYDERAIMMLELEATSAVSARLLLLARLTLVFGFNLGLMFGASAVLSLLRDDLTLWPLVMSWFAPMTFLSALSFFASVLMMDALAGGLLGLSLWMIHVVLRYAALDNVLVLALSAPGLTVQENRPLLLLAALLLTVVALWLAGLQERFDGGVL